MDLLLASQPNPWLVLAAAIPVLIFGLLLLAGGEVTGRAFRQLMSRLGQLPLDIGTGLKRGGEISLTLVSHHFLYSASAAQPAPTAPVDQAPRTAFTITEEVGGDTDHADHADDPALLDGWLPTTAAAGTPFAVPARAGLAQTARPADGPEPASSPLEVYAWAGPAWLGEILYLVLIVVVAGADTVFAAYRLSAILFPELDVNFPSWVANQLGVLTGMLFAALALLLGFLAIDLMGALPPSMQLFPGVAAKTRRTLVFSALVCLLLTGVAGALVGFLGQVLATYEGTLAFRALNVVAGTVLTLSIFGTLVLAGWGVLRGVWAAIGLPVALVLGLALSLVGTVLAWLGELTQMVGDTGGDVLEAAGDRLRFHSTGVQPPIEPTMTESSVVIIGYGNRSSEFASQLSADVIALGGPRYLRAAGVAADDPNVQHGAVQQLRAAGLRTADRNLSPRPGDPRPESTLGQRALGAFARPAQAVTSQRDTTPKSLLWVVDYDDTTPEHDKLQQSLSALTRMRALYPGLVTTLICLLPERLSAAPGQASVGNAERLYARLESLATAGDSEHGPTIALTFLVLSGITAAESVSADDPHQQGVSEDIKQLLLTRSLAALLTASNQRGNTTFDDVVQRARAENYHFAALAAYISGVLTDLPTRGRAAARRRRAHGAGIPFLPHLSLRAKDLLRDLLRGVGASSVAATPTSPGCQPLAAVCLVPLHPEGAPMSDFRGEMEREVAERQIPLLSVTADNGVPRFLPVAGSDRYCQVAVVFGVRDLRVAATRPPPSRVSASR